MFGRRTKIVATLGPATDPPGVLDRLVAAGVDCARLNCSHGTHDDLRRRAAAVRATAERAGGRSGCCSTCRAPSCGCPPPPRRACWQTGESVIFCGSGGSEPPDRVRVDFPHFAALITERSQIVIGDGVPRLAVEGVAAGEVVAARALAGAAVGPQGRQRHLRPPGAARDHREGHRRPGPRGRAGRGLRRAVVRALGRGHRAAARAHGRARLPRRA